MKHRAGVGMVLGPSFVALLTNVVWVGEGRATSQTIVISQVYGGGGNSGADYKNDFIELFNRGTTAVDVTGWSVQYASAAGSSWQVTVLSGTIGAGRYYLVREAQGSGGTLDLPAPDRDGAIAMSATNGKVALVAASAALSGACPSAASYVDLVGYGASASCAEGAHPAPTLGNTTAAVRRGGGCVETDDNAADFVESAPHPRNSAVAAHPCSAAVEPPIHAIQGSGSVSLLRGNVVMTSGIVTGVRSNGFFLQTEDALADGGPATSEGIFVHTGGAVSSEVVGDRIRVTGTVAEYAACEDSSGPSLTEIDDVFVIVTLSTGNPLPAAIEITAADTAPGGVLDLLERLEGMRVRIGSLTVVAPTSAAQGSRRAFYGVVAGVARPFREPGVEAPWPIPSPPCCIPRFDGNAERLRVESDPGVGAPIIDVAAGATVTDLAGILSFSDCTQTILPEPGTAPAVSDTVGPSPVPAAGAEQITLGSANLHNFFDDVNDPDTDDDVLTSAELADRLAKTSLAIRTILGLPDILGVVEVENIAVLRLLAERVGSDAVATGLSAPAYEAYLEEGNDGRGIDVGFLVKTSRVTVVDTVQLGGDMTHVSPITGLPVTTFDRPPLALRALAAPAAGPPFAITVIVNHLKSLIDIELSAEGQAVRAKRHAQAEFLASLIQQRQAADPSEHLAVIGDFNAFEVNDGYVDVMGAIRGDPAAPDAVERASADLVDPDLIDLVERLPQTQRYSYVFRGNAQALDHVLVNPSLLRHLVSFAFARGNADFPVSLAAASGRPERHSDHDAAVATFTVREPGRVRRLLRAAP